jgi:hypothetical protein
MDSRTSIKNKKMMSRYINKRHSTERNTHSRNSRNSLQIPKIEKTSSRNVNPTILPHNMRQKQSMTASQQIDFVKEIDIDSVRETLTNVPSANYILKLAGKMDQRQNADSNTNYKNKYMTKQQEPDMEPRYGGSSHFFTSLQHSIDDNDANIQVINNSNYRTDTNV